jgi:hypothetical protein
MRVGILKLAGMKTFNLLNMKKGQYYNWHMDSFYQPFKNHKFSQYEGKIRKISCSVFIK